MCVCVREQVGVFRKFSHFQNLEPTVFRPEEDAVFINTNCTILKSFVSILARLWKARFVKFLLIGVILRVLVFGFCCCCCYFWPLVERFLLINGQYHSSRAATTTICHRKALHYSCRHSPAERAHYKDCTVAAAKTFPFFNGGSFAARESALLNCTRAD